MVPKIENILFVSDLSDDSQTALAWSMMLAHQHDAQLTFLHVIEIVRPQAKLAARTMMGEDRWQEMSDSHRREINSQVAKRIHRFCGDVMAGMAACPRVVDRVVIKQGVPADVILKEVDSKSYDLVAMGSDGAKSFKAAGKSTIARHIIQRGRIPVFIVPPQENRTTTAG